MVFAVNVVKIVDMNLKITIGLHISKREKKQITTIAVEYHLEKISINPS